MLTAEDAEVGVCIIHGNVEILPGLCKNSGCVLYLGHIIHETTTADSLRMLLPLDKEVLGEADGKTEYTKAPCHTHVDDTQGYGDASPSFQHLVGSDTTSLHLLHLVANNRTVNNLSYTVPSLQVQQHIVLS